MNNTPVPAVSEIRRRYPRFQAAWALFRRELSAYFQTPIAYVFGVVFLALTAVLFFSVFFLFEQVEMRQFFRNLPILLAVLMPALSMRLIAEERRRGTYEVLATLPLRTADIIGSKFLAVWITGLFLLLPTLCFVITVSSFGVLDPGPVLGGYFGAALLAAAFAAVGVFSSSASRNETVALILGLVITLFLTILDGFLVLMPPFILPVAQYLSIGYHFSGFSRGIVDSRSIIYLVSVTVFFLVLADRQLARQR